MPLHLTAKTSAERVNKLQEYFINVFTLPDFHNKDDKPIIMNFINNSIITRPYPVKRIIPLPFGFGRVGQVFGKFFSGFNCGNSSHGDTSITDIVKKL